MEVSQEVWGFGLGISVYLMYVFKQSYFEVKEGYLAVSSIFGRAIFDKTKENQTLKTYGPGLHWKWPWQKVQEVSLMEQIIELSGEDGGTLAMASDGTMLRLDSKLRFTPLKQDLYKYIFSIEKPLEHVKGLFICLLRNEIANFDHHDSLEKIDPKQNLTFLPQTEVGSYAAIRRERRLLNHKIQEFCRRQIGDRYGIRFDGVDLTDILPPDELAQALNGVINAQSEAHKLYAQTQGECEQRLLAARKGLKIAQAKSVACEEEISTMGKILADLQEDGTLQHYVQRRRVEVFSEARTAFIQR